MNKKIYRYLTTKEVMQKFPFTKGQLDAFLHYKYENGLHRAVFKVGKRLFFRLDLFQKWIESNPSNPGIICETSRKKKLRKS